jgi:hypothetical protein
MSPLRDLLCSDTIETGGLVQNRSSDVVILGAPAAAVGPHGRNFQSRVFVGSAMVKRAVELGWARER